MGSAGFITTPASPPPPPAQPPAAATPLRYAAMKSTARPVPPLVDHSEWILGGLWPPQLQEPTAATAPVAEELDADLRSLAACANQQLSQLGRAGPPWH